MIEKTTTNRTKRAQVIDAAVEEFQSRGFAAASMDSVSAAAGVSKRTLYKYFESKENLFQTIVAELSERVEGTLDIRYDPDRDIRAQLTALAMAEGRLLTSPDVMAMSRMIIGETLRSPELAAAVQGKIDKRSAFVEMFERASADGKLAPLDAGLAADELIGLIKVRAFWPVIFGAPILTDDQMREVADQSVEMILARYGPGGAA